MVTVNFEQMDKKGLKSLIDKFDKAALPVTDVAADNKSIRESGFPIKTATLTFESGQVLVLKVKASNDLYQAKLNGKVLAIKNYHKAETFTDEVIAYVKANEPAYAKNKAKQLARVKVAVPKVKVASTSIAEQIQTFATSLEEIGGQREAISSQITALQPTIETKKATLSDLTAKLDAENAASTALQKQLDDLQSGIMESAGTATKTAPKGWKSATEDDKEHDSYYDSCTTVFVKTMGGKGTDYAKFDMSILFDSDTGKYIPQHGSKRMPPESSAAAAAKTVESWFDSLDDRSKMTVEAYAKKQGKVLESAGTAPVQLDRLQIANDMMHGDGRHPKLKAAFVEGFNNSCSISDAIAFIESFSDDELTALLKDEENIFEGVALKAGGKIAVMSREDFLSFVKAADDTQILEAVESFNAFQENQGTPARVMIFESLDDVCPAPDTEVPVQAIGSGWVGPSDGTVIASKNDGGTYAIRREESGYGYFEDTTLVTPFVYAPPVTVTLGAKGNCPMCGAAMDYCGDDTSACPSCGCKTDLNGTILESAKPLQGGTAVTLKGHREAGDALAGKEGIILESVPTAQGPFYKVKVDGLIYRGVAPGMVLEGINLEIDKSGTHDASDPQHIDDPDHENYGDRATPCPWCGSDVRENRCIQCNRQIDMAKADRKTWEAANKALAANDFPSQYE